MSKYNSVYNLAKILGCRVRYNEPLSIHTTFKIGGDCSLYIEVDKISQLSEIIKLCNQQSLNYYIIGKGSNLVVADKGVDKVIISLSGDMKRIEKIGEDTLYCGAGCSLAGLCKEAEKLNLSGLEFAWGIPGSVGGAAFMNAGAYGGEMKDVILSVHHVDKDGNVGKIRGEDLNFGYRHSIYKENGFVITGITLRLSFDNKIEIHNRMEEYMNRRKEKQPLNYPSAGSVFRRPEGNYAGTLIERCGLKGKTIGGAQVSPKHAGFIVNIGGATAENVKELVSLVQKTVKDETGYELKREIIYLD